jgi:hypothetical protein
MLQKRAAGLQLEGQRKGRFLDTGGHRVKQTEHLTVCTSGKFTPSGSKKRLNILKFQGYNK